ncbi:MAG: ankyrin repeat domain-containing protein [Alphaproteobacteria bacterium]
MSIFVKQDRLNQRLGNRIRYHYPIEDIKKALDAGADAKGTAKDSYTERRMISWAAEDGRAEVIRLLVERGADPNSGEGGRYTPLMRVVTNGSSEAAKALLELGAKPEIKNYDGETPLLIAAKNGQGDIVRALVEHGADINARNAAGETALHLVAAKGHANLVKYLMDKGADITAANINMNTPADVAEKDFPRIADMIKGVTAAPSVPAVPSDWSLTEPDEVARVKDKTLIGYRVTEIFNFSARLYTQIARNLETRAESQSVKGFTELGDGAAVEAAHAALVKLGGKVNTIDKVKLPGPGQGT